MGTSATKIWVAQGQAELQSNETHTATNSTTQTDKRFLFFSGANLQHDRFPSPPWDTVVEYAP